MILYAKDNLIEFYILTTIINKEYETKENTITECWRRSDLVRFGKFTSDSYVWSWKGGIKAGKGVDSRYNLFPIPERDLNANPNLIQNEGY